MTAFYRLLIGCWWLISCATTGHAQTTPLDTLGADIALIDTLPCISFQQYKGKEFIAGSIGIVNRSIINGTDQTSLLNSIQSVPGVFMEQRGYGGSHRLSIRGSSLRSPFAVRNIKMYLDGIPLTSPDGQAPIELMDMSDIERIEIIKGPAGSMYGSGNGGVMLFTPRLAPAGTYSTELSEQIGGFGMFRLAFSAAKSGEKNSFRISYVDQTNRGYREQERNARRQLSLYLRQQLTESQTLTFYGTYYHGGWELPGALTAAQAADNPRQAVTYSKEQDAELARKRWMGGLSYLWKVSKNFKQQIALYAYSTLKENPYGTSSGNSGYKDEGADGFGGRADWQWNWQRKRWRHELQWGGEWQTEKYNILESKLVNSQPGDFKYLYDIGYITAMGFASGNLSWGKHMTLQYAVSNNQFIQDIRGFTASGFVFDTTMTLKSQWLPRLAIQSNWSDGFHAFAAWSKGNSNPTAFEAIDQENNSYNLQLTPELGENREIGIKHRLPSIRLYYELSVYDFRLSKAILPYSYTVNDSTSFTRYHNEGNTVQRGLEWLIQWEALESDVAKFHLWTSGTIQAYRFRDYLLDGDNYMDKFIAGTPMAMASTGIQWQWKNRLSLYLIHQWYDRTPLNNANSVWSNPYQLVHLKCAYSFRMKPCRWFKEESDADAPGAKISLYGGVNNLLNTAYSAYYQYNAFGGKFYNPAPSIHAYFGISWGY